MVYTRKKMDSSRSMRRCHGQAIDVRKGLEKETNLYNSLFKRRGARCYLEIYT